MTAAQQCDQAMIAKLLLTDDHAADLLAQLIEQLRNGLHQEFSFATENSFNLVA
jgi:hypothetical protein